MKYLTVILGLALIAVLTCNATAMLIERTEAGKMPANKVEIEKGALTKNPQKPIIEKIVPPEPVPPEKVVLEQILPMLASALDDPELIAGVLPNKGEGYIKGLIQSLETLGFSSQEISCTLTDILPALYRKGITAPSGIIPFLQGLKETLESHYLTLRKDLIDPIAELIEAESTQNLNRVIDDLNQILNLMDTLIGSSPSGATGV